MAPSPEPPSVWRLATGTDGDRAVPDVAWLEAPALAARGRDALAEPLAGLRGSRRGAGRRR